MRSFNITERIEIRCESKGNMQGFKHVATLYIDGVKRQTASVQYINRTWERYDFQTVMQCLVEKSKVLSDAEKKVCQKFLAGDHADMSLFKNTAMVAAMGDIFGKTKKEKNDWKTRMLKAGLEKKGLMIPEDWDELDEDEKEKRLNKLVALAGSVGK